MAPLPKKKHSKKRQGGRSAHFGIKPIALSKCPQCQSARLPHRVCASCGYYNGREVILTDSEAL
jgi:large subunit ribosomal protein L32